MWDIHLSVHLVIPYVELSSLVAVGVFTSVYVCVRMSTHFRTLNFKYWGGNNTKNLVTPHVLSTQKSRGHL